MQIVRIRRIRLRMPAKYRLLPDIHRQLQSLRNNLDVVQGKLAGMIICAPVNGLVTAIDLKVGEHRSPGERLAEVTPQASQWESAL